MSKASVILSQFNAGEWSPLLEGQVNLAKYPNAAAYLENYIPTVQGPAVRRAGTRFVNEVKNSNNKTWLVRFEFNTTQAYQLEFGDLYIRFYANHGMILAGGLPYEVASPYAIADLTNSDGTFALSFVQSGDVIYVAHPNYPPQKLSRFSDTSWTFAPVNFTWGPFGPLNGSTTTVYASAGTGSITLNASASIFQLGHVGALFYLAEKDVRSTKQWQAGVAFTTGDIVRSGGINYKALTTATSGGVKPSHTSGATFDGSPGVQWQYLDPGYGYVQITGYVSATQVNATVIQNIPDNAVGAGNPSVYWAMGAWNAVDGYPSLVTFFRERLTWAKSRNLNLSVAGDYENYASKDGGGNVVADMAISIQIVSKEVNNIRWMDPGQDLLIGTAGGEFICAELTRNQVFGAENVTIRTQTGYGSSNVKPTLVGSSLVYIQRAARKAREMSYDYGTDKYKSTDLTILSEHISKSGLVNSSYQQEPYSIIWYARADGMLVGFTFNREQDVIAWHRHPIGGNGVVESLSCIPSPDGSRNELWMIVKRFVNGAYHRYVEWMEVEHQVGGDPESSFYVDCGLTYDGKVNTTLTPASGALINHATGIVFTAGSATWVSGSVGREIHYRYTTLSTDVSGNPIVIYETAKAVITGYTDSTHVICTINSAFPSIATIPANGWRMTVTSISGLNHLEGSTVDVLVNGATHPQRVVNLATISLQEPASVVHVGLPCPAKLKTMRLNQGAADGTSQGKVARVNKATVRMLETLGMKYGENFTTMDEIPFRTAFMQMDNPPDLFTGDIVLDWPGDYDLHPWLCFMNDQPLPSTIVSVMPQVTVEDR